jgi:hypothetical protein
MPPEPTPLAPPEGAELTFNSTISPLFENRCGACHSEANSLYGLDLTSYEGILQGSQGGEVIVIGDPENSRIIIIQRADQPHFAQLTMDELELVAEWIVSGAPEE